MKKPLLCAMAATLLAGSGVQAQDEMMMTPPPSRFTIGVYGGLAYSTSWAELGRVPAFAGARNAPARPGQAEESISPGLAPMFGGIGMFNIRGIGLRLHYGYMPSHIYETEDNFQFPDDYPLNNHFYDLSLLFRPFAGRMGGFLGSAYAFVGGGGLTSDYADGARTCPEGGVVQGINRRDVLLFCNPSPSTVGQFTAGLGGDIFSLFGLGFFLEGAVHGYDSPTHVRNEALGANDRFAFTPNIKLGIAFGFGAPRAPELPPPPPPAPELPPTPVEPPPPPPETPIRVCVLEAGQLREVDAMVNPTTGDTMAVMAGERRRFSEAFPATTGYAAGADFFVQDRPIRFGGREYVRFGLTRIIPATDVRPIGTFQGTTLFAETGANERRPDVLYVLVRPGCEFQPYQTRPTPKG